jgi:hypothetical protein
VRSGRVPVTVFVIAVANGGIFLKQVVQQLRQRDPAENVFLLRRIELISGSLGDQYDSIGGCPDLINQQLSFFLSISFCYFYLVQGGICISGFLVEQEKCQIILGDGMASGCQTF